MSIRNLLLGQILAFVALLTVVLWATLTLARSDGGDALYINIAGRQRMLSQKAAKEAIRFAQAPTRANRELLEGTVQLFAQSHRALRYGGIAQAGLNGTAVASVQAPADAKLIELLDEVDSNWKAMNIGIEQLLEEAEKRAEAIAVIRERAPQVLDNMDQAVRYFAIEANADPIAVNVAGRQRMLSQRAALQAFLFDADPSTTAQEALQSTIDLFSTSHKALRRGGRIATRLRRHTAGAAGGDSSPPARR